jgi:hypothetical protein
LILQDTREKNPFDLFPHDVKIQKLHCGDYTTALLVDNCVIERKATTHEVYLNLGKKVNKERFYRELEKLAKLPNPRIVTEFPESDIYIFPENSTIPKFRYASPYEVKAGKFAKGERIDAWAELRINGKRLRSLLYEVEEIVPVIYCVNRQVAQAYMLNLFKELENGLGTVT